MLDRTTCLQWTQSGWILGVVLLVVLGGTGEAHGQSRSMGEQTLKDLEGVRVVVEQISDTAEARGVHASDLAVDVTQDLKAAGLRVYSESERQATEAKPVLYVHANVFTREGRLFAYNVKVDVRQRVTTTTDVDVLAPTYIVFDRLGTVGAAHLSNLRAVAREQVRVFIDDWTEVHSQP